MFSPKKDMNNLKDTKGMPAPYEAGGFRSGSYTKTSKLITALYMVTDIMDSDEPLRTKLRTSGLEILSDPSASLSTSVSVMRIEQILSFLNISTTMNLISEMNGNILIKEFTALKASLQEHTDVKPSWLEEFLAESPLLNQGGAGGGNFRHPTPTPLLASRGGNSNHKGHIGVQKASTLMKALKDMSMSDRDSFNMLKQERRNEILKTIKISPDGATISDIRSKAVGVLAGCSEKTMQRELMSMTKDGVLNKTGEKRWSKYFIKN